jgi:hypothetical protein
VNVPVNIAGYAETLAALEQFDGRLYRRMNREIAVIMLRIRNKSVSYIPANSELLSNWTSASKSSKTTVYRAFPKFDASKTAAGIIYKEGDNFQKGKAFKVSHYVANTSPGGAIYETAGRKSGLAGNKYTKSLNPEASQQFIAQFSKDSLVGSPRKKRGRLIYRAWAEDEGRAQHSILKIIESAIIQFNKSNANSILDKAA